MALSKEELVATYGWPRRVESDREYVFSFEHDSLESAQAFAEADEDHYGHTAWTEVRDGRFLSHVDITQAIRDIDARFTDG